MSTKRPEVRWALVGCACVLSAAVLQAGLSATSRAVPDRQTSIVNVIQLSPIASAAIRTHSVLFAVTHEMQSNGLTWG